MTISFKEYIQIVPLKEGGNVSIAGVDAERIDLKRIPREAAVVSFKKGLEAMNASFEKFSGFPLWDKNLIKTTDFLSGSTQHFFDLSIPTDKFVSVKKSVGDLDLQVDGASSEIIKQWLDSLSTGKKLGSLSFVGYKYSSDQYITLWKSLDFGIAVQIDLELVEYIDGRPTHWSRISHASAWDDMQKGIKGVAAKYAWRAMTARTEHDIILLKGKRETPTKSSSSLFAASLKGIRNRIEPVIDETTGKQKIIDGLPVYKDIPSKGATYYNDTTIFFSLLFGVENPNASDVAKVESFTGMIELMNKYLSKQDQKNVLDKYVELLFGKGAQGLYRGDKLRDFREKSVILRYICDGLGFSVSQYIPTIKKYYK